MIDQVFCIEKLDILIFKKFKTLQIFEFYIKSTSESSSQGKVCENTIFSLPLFVGTDRSCLFSLFLRNILNFCKNPEDGAADKAGAGGSSFDELLELSLLLELLCLLKCSAESIDCGGTSVASTRAEGKLALDGIDFDGFLHLKNTK